MSRHLADITTDWIELPDGVQVSKPFFAVSDIHGHADILRELIEIAEEISESHELVILGDITDRGPDSLGCVEEVLRAKTSPAFSDVITLMGNHDQILADYAHAPEDETARKNIKTMGGAEIVVGVLLEPETIEVYRSYVGGLRYYHVNGGVVITHALPNPGLALPEQAVSTLLWSPAHQDYRGGWDKLTGRPTILLHGHTRNGVKILGSSQKGITDDLRAELRDYGRVCCDVATPWDLVGALFEFSGNRFRAHIVNATKARSMGIGSV